MKTLFLYLLLLAIIPLKIEAQSIDSIANSYTKKRMSIEELIKLKSKDKQQLEFLQKFRESFDKKDRIIVKEFADYYEMTVTHPSSGKSSGGAESYRLDKKTGKWEMKWHEHPMRFK